jgi:hypothetical protein
MLAPLLLLAACTGGDMSPQLGPDATPAGVADQTGAATPDTSSQTSTTPAPSLAGASLTTTSCSNYSSYTRLVSVSTASQLSSAITNARPGDKIKLADGTYNGKWTVRVSGTSSAPIVLCGSANAVINGGSKSSGAGIHLKASRWVVAGMTITNAQVGVAMSGGNYNTVDGVTVHDVGQAGMHIHMFSSYNTVKNSRIYNTGRVNPGYGEGVYVGTADNMWSTVTGGKPDTSNHNQVINTKFGPGITADNIDVKPGTSYGVFNYNTLDGSGHVSGYSSAPPVWVSVKGNYNTIAYNAGSVSDQDGFENKVLAGYGHYNTFTGNVANVQGPGYGFRIGTGVQGLVLKCANTVTNAKLGFSNRSCTN